MLCMCCVTAILSTQNRLDSVVFHNFWGSQRIFILNYCSSFVLKNGDAIIVTVKMNHWSGES